MSFLCKIGLHTWNGCKCERCGKTRSSQHNWLEDCETCSTCGKTRENQHDWLVDCEVCHICGKKSGKTHNIFNDKCKHCNHLQGHYVDERDGKIYPYIKIGKLVWMTDNFAYNTQYGCFAYDNVESNASKYGYLYNWSTAERINLKVGAFHLQKKFLT